MNSQYKLFIVIWIILLANMYYHYMMRNCMMYYFRWQMQKNRRMIIHDRLHNNLKNLMQSTQRYQKKGPNKMRSNDWWENIVCKTFTEKDWYENFRVSKSIFNYICEQLRETLTPKPNPVDNKDKNVTVQKKIAVSLYYLASCCEYRVAGNQFGLHKSTVCKILHEVVNAVNVVLDPKFMTMPSEEEAVEISNHFENVCHIPNIIGAIDGTHIPILPPSDGYRDFINRKGWPSIVMQGVVDHKYRFRDISVKNPGSTHDASVLKTSNLYKRCNVLLPNGTKELDGFPLRYVLIGDPAYPLLPWLLKGYVENAFGRLKARWRTLLKRIDVHYSFVPSVVATCCVLHNIIESFKGKFKKEWLQDVQEAERIFPQPGRLQHNRYEDLDGHHMRELLRAYLAQNFDLRQ